MKLHLGVIDIPYTNGAVTTGQVAQWLEDKYNVMATYYALNDQKIADGVVQGLLDASVDLRLGAAISIDPFGDAMAEGEKMFKSFLTDGVMESLGIPGVPTMAAIRRRSLRFKAKKSKSTQRRPSFVDTGLYRQSFKMWVDY